MYHPPPFTFILQVREQVYLNIASIHLGVKVECEVLPGHYQSCPMQPQIAAVIQGVQEVRVAAMHGRHYCQKRVKA